MPSGKALASQSLRELTRTWGPTAPAAQGHGGPEREALGTALSPERGPRQCSLESCCDISACLRGRRTECPNQGAQLQRRTFSPSCSLGVRVTVSGGLVPCKACVLGVWTAIFSMVSSRGRPSVHVCPDLLVLGGPPGAGSGPPPC